MSPSLMCLLYSARALTTLPDVSGLASHVWGHAHGALVLRVRSWPWWIALVTGGVPGSDHVRRIPA